MFDLEFGNIVAGIRGKMLSILL